jgi:hypothetical protein
MLAGLEVELQRLGRLDVDKCLLGEAIGNDDGDNKQSSESDINIPFWAQLYMCTTQT